MEKLNRRKTCEVIIYQQNIKNLFIYQDTQDGYEKGRRETWSETVGRYFDFFTEHLQEQNDFKLDDVSRKRLEEAVLSQKVMNSMRCLMTAGEALKRKCFWL